MDEVKKFCKLWSKINQKSVHKTFINRNVGQAKSSFFKRIVLDLILVFYEIQRINRSEPFLNSGAV